MQTQDRRYAVDLKIRAEFPTLGRVLTVASVEVRSGDRQIESLACVISPEFIDRDWIKELQTGLPIRITWRAMGSQSEFVGYVYTKEGENVNASSILGVGIGFPLLRGHNHAVPFSTYVHAIKTVCNSHLLGASVSARANQQQNIAQGVRTDWDWIKHITMRAGWSCHFRGANLVAHDLGEVRDFSVQSPTDVIVPRRGRFRVTTNAASKVRSFVVYREDDAPGEVQSRSVYASITSSGEVFNSASSQYRRDLRDSSFDTQTLTSPQDAAFEVSTYEYGTRWEDGATLIMDYDAGIGPLDVIRTWSTDHKLMGVWTVRSIITKLGNHDATMEIKLGREVATDRLRKRDPGTTDQAYAQAIRSTGDGSWYRTPELRPDPNFYENRRYIWTPGVVYT
jgi:hypothetical protein